MPKTVAPGAAPADRQVKLDFWNELSESLLKLNAHFTKMGWRGILSGTPTRTLSLLMPGGGEMIVKVHESPNVAISKDSQMTTKSTTPYQVLVTILTPGRESINSAVGLMPDRAEPMCDQIMKLVEQTVG